MRSCSVVSLSKTWNLERGSMYKPLVMGCVGVGSSSFVVVVLYLCVWESSLMTTLGGSYV